VVLEVPDTVAVVADLAVKDTMEAEAARFNLRVPMKCEVKVGETWSCKG